MRLSIKSIFDGRIGSVKFATHFTVSPFSPVVTFPSSGSEGHGVQPPQGYSVFCYISVVPKFFFRRIYRGYFMVGECGRFFFTSCERRERTSERSERVSSATPRNE